MIKQILLWILKDEIISIAEHEAQKIVGVFYSVRSASPTNDLVETDKLDLFAQANPGFHGFIDKVYLKKGDKRIFINDFTVQGEEQYTSRNLAGPVLSASDEDLAPAKPLVSVDIEQSPDSTKEKEIPWYFHNVLSLLNEGISDHEIYKKVYMSITDIQYQDALGWAKEQRGVKPTEVLSMPEPTESVFGTARKSNRGTRPPKYDAKAIEEAIRAGDKLSEVAKAHGISLPTAYKIKREMEGKENS